MRIAVKKLILMAVLTAVALIIFIIEAQIPLPIPVPGVKLGLANAVTLFALFYNHRGQTEKTVPDDGTLTTANAFAILICRIILGALFTGRAVVILYSLTGGLLGFAAQALMKSCVTAKQIWVCGATGAVFHNIGQILAATLITGTPSIAVYLPVLVIAGIFTGVITGLTAQFTLARLSKISFP
jgi:heptaprenyl diphosphate synthase